MLSSTSIAQQDQNLNSQQEISEEELYLEKLDFNYLRTCKDANEVTKCIEILLEGKLGHYPDLLNCARDRLHEIDPLRAEKYYPKEHFKPSYAEIKSIQDDLLNWTKETKENEALLPKKKTRSTNKTTEPNISAVKSADEKGMLLVKEMQAEQLKLKGNESLKSGDFDFAIDYYTKSLDVLEQTHVLNNRSLAFYKKKLFSEALEDASRSIELDSSQRNVKAFLRRAMAKKSKGLYFDALDDFIVAQKYDPENKEYDSYRRETEFKYLEVEGVRSKELPEGCSPEAIAKQAKLRSENKGFRRLQVVEEDLEEAVDDHKDATKEKNDMDSVQEPRIIELPDEIPATNNQPKIVELPDDYQDDEQNGVTENESFNVKDLDDDFKTIKICEIIEEDEYEDYNVVVEVQTVENQVEAEKEAIIQFPRPKNLSELENITRKHVKNHPLSVRQMLLSISSLEMEGFLSKGRLMDSTLLSAVIAGAVTSKPVNDDSEENRAALLQHLKSLAKHEKFAFLSSLLTNTERIEMKKLLEN